MRAYTVKEIDDLRDVCEMRYDFGTTNPGHGTRVGRAYYEKDKTKAIEEMLRTYLIAGITAEDILKKDRG